MDRESLWLVYNRRVTRYQKFSYISRRLQTIEWFDVEIVKRENIYGAIERDRAG